MRSARLVVLAACGGSPKAAAPMPAAAPAATTVATSDPAPPGIAPDPCEGGEIAPASNGAVGGEGAVIGHGAGIGQGGGDPCGGGGEKRIRAPGTITSPSVAGALDEAVVLRYIKRNVQRIRTCYVHELASHPGLAGKVAATFEIGPDGRVTTSDATGLPGVDTCIAGVIKSIEFPKQPGPTTAHLGFAFQPST